MKRLFFYQLALTMAVPGAGLAQNVVDAREFDLENWNYEPLSSGGVWSNNATFGAPVYGVDDAEIGDVEDIVLNDGEVIAVFAEVGKIWNIGDTHIRVPQEQVSIEEDQRIRIPVTENTIDQFDLFKHSGLPPTNLDEEKVAGVDDVPLGLLQWRATDLMGDYVRLLDDNSAWINFGYVTDILVECDQISATVVRTTGAYNRSTFAFPYGNRRAVPVERQMNGTFDDYGNWVPTSPIHDLPLLVGGAIVLPSFEPERMQAN